MPENSVSQNPDRSDKPMVRLANPRRVTMSSLANARTHAELHQLAAEAAEEARTPAASPAPTGTASRSADGDAERRAS